MARSRTTAAPAAARRGVAALTRFAAAAVSGDGAAAARALAAARRAGLPRLAAEETALMLMPNAGYPAALEALRVLAAAWPGRPRRRREGGPSAWRRRGRVLCRAVYGPVYGRLMEALESLHPDFAAWVIEEGYGRVLSRPGLRPAERELVAVAVLAALGWERQLLSHLRGAGRVGAHRREIRAAFAAGVRRGDGHAHPVAARAWTMAFPRRTVRSGP
jgi:4-carboxymuconolactone decarboxylase